MAALRSIRLLRKPYRLSAEKDRRSPFAGDLVLAGDKTLDGSDIQLNDGLPLTDVIYDSSREERSEIPFAVLTSDEGYDLLAVTVRSPIQDHHGHVFTLSTNLYQPGSGGIVPHGPLLESEATVLGSETVFTMKLSAPWVPVGIRQNVEWILRPARDDNDADRAPVNGTKEHRAQDDADAQMELGSTPLEFYAIQSPVPAFFSERGGIPLLFLRMFLLPVLRLDLRGSDRGDSSSSSSSISDDFKKAYIKLVADILGGQRSPVTGARAADPSATHWLKFDGWDGHFAFLDPATGTFDLAAWLDAYRAHLATGSRELANGYDQACAAELALSLGVPFSEIAWEFHQFFGYVSEKGTELVGWGPANNPYFGSSSSSSSSTHALVVEPTQEGRTKFIRHLFLSVGPLASGNVFLDPGSSEPDGYDAAGERVVVDPTLNPGGRGDSARGLHSRATYYAAAKDAGPVPEIERALRYREVHRWAPGITGFVAAADAKAENEGQGKGKGKEVGGVGFGADSHSSVRALDIFRLHWGIEPALVLDPATVAAVGAMAGSGRSGNEEKGGGAEGEGAAVALDVRELMGAGFRDVVSSGSSVAGWRDVPLAPVVGDSVARFECRVRRVDGPLGFKYLRLYVTDGLETALGVLTGRLDLFTSSNGPEIAVRGPGSGGAGEEAGAGFLQVSLTGGKDLDVFVYENLVVEIGGLAMEPPREVLVRAAWEYLRACPLVAPEEWRRPLAEEYLRAANGASLLGGDLN